MNLPALLDPSLKTSLANEPLETFEAQLFRSSKPLQAVCYIHQTRCSEKNLPRPSNTAAVDEQESNAKSSQARRRKRAQRFELLSQDKDAL